MQRVSIPWAAWYENSTLEIAFPDDWNVEKAEMGDAPEATDDELRKAFAHPIDSPTIAELARGKKTVAIAVDDMTRPTEGYRLMPFVLEELEQAGIERENIVVIMALGSHRALTRQDLVKKFGEQIVRNYRIHNHCPFDNLVDVGNSKYGTPIRVNRFFMEADLKIAVGFIVPHPQAGWGGGGKIIIPGVCAIETLASFHGPRFKNPACRATVIEGNELREDIDDVAQHVGLDIIVNAVGNSKAKTSKLFVGDILKAHRAGVRQAQEVYVTPVPKDIDVAVFNAYPEDQEFLQCIKALNIWSDPDREVVKKGGTIVVTTAASEGNGCHYLGDFGMTLFRKAEERPNVAKIMAGRNLVFFSPNCQGFEVRGRFPEGTELYTDWNELIENVAKRHGKGTHAVVFPTGSLQFAKK